MTLPVSRDRRVLLVIGLLLAIAITASVAVEPPTSVGFSERWNDVRAKQPEGLTLELKLPKKSYFQGEVISGELFFSNTSPTKYRVWTSTSCMYQFFYALGENGRNVTDPLAWCDGYNREIHGSGSYRTLGTATIPVTANDWLRFDKPGRYRLYAWSERAQPGDVEGEKTETRPVELVSDMVTIEITTLTAAQERLEIAEAQADLADNKTAEDAVERLRCLQSPAARAILRPLLHSHVNMGLVSRAEWGLLCAPKPAEEAAPLLLAVRRGEFLAGYLDDITRLYGFLRTYEMRRAARPEQGEQIYRTEKAARDEIYEAGRAALKSGRAPASAVAALTMLLDYSEQPKVRVRLLAHQDELTPFQIHQLCDNWEAIGGPDFVPILRQAAAPPRYNLDALQTLARVSPDAARQLIVADIACDEPHYLKQRNPSQALHVLATIPGNPLPELDPILHKRLAEGRNLSVSLALVARFASTNLLPEVTTLLHKNEGRWPCDQQAAALRYWIRCNPREGVTALEQALAAREGTNCYRTVLRDVLLDQWTDEAWRLVNEALRDPDPQVSYSAEIVLNHCLRRKGYK